MDYISTINNGNKLIKNGEHVKCLELYKKFLTMYPHNEDIKNKISKLEEIIIIKEKINTCRNNFYYYKSLQMALKLVLNGIYGAFANSYFVLSNSVIANSITGVGRNIIHHIMMKIEDYFYNRWHDNKSMLKLLGTEYIAMKDNQYYFLDKNYQIIDRPYLSLNTGDSSDILESRKIKIDKLEPINKQVGDFHVLYEYFIHDFTNAKPLDNNPKFDDVTTKTGENIKMYGGNNPLIIYGDTDSISPDSIIHTDKGDITIEKLFNENIKKCQIKMSLTGKESVSCDEKILNWTKDKKLYHSDVKRLIRHVVKKEKWEIKLKTGESIRLTNDHSVIIFRDNVQLTVKPRDINIKTDKILRIYDI
jgi:hypothetical protein